MTLLAACQAEEDLGLRTSSSGGAYDGTEDELCEINIARGATPQLALATTAYTDTTYRAQLFYRDANLNQWPRLDSLMAPYSGTYCNPKDDNTWLTPCSVDANYEYGGSEGSQYGLRAGRYHNYYMVLCSPAVEFVQYGSDVIKPHPNYPNDASKQGTMKYYGLAYKRTGDRKDHPAVSPVTKVTTYGVTLYDNAKAQYTYLYNLADTMKLREYRSGMAFSIRCGDAISSATFKRVTVKGLRKQAVYRPFQKDFYFEDVTANYEDVTIWESPSGVTLYTGGTTEAPAYGESQSLTSATTNEHLDDTQTNTYFNYVLSGNYAELDINNQYVRTPPTLCVTLLNSDGGEIQVDPLLMPVNFEPQTNYFFMITMNSVYVTVTVTARAWSTPYDVNEEVTDPDPLTLTFNISDWTSHTGTADVDPGGGGGGSSDPETVPKPSVNAEPWNTPSGGSGSIDDDTPSGGDES